MTLHTRRHVAHVLGEVLGFLGLCALAIVGLLALSMADEPLTKAQWEARLASKTTLEPQ